MPGKTSIIWFRKGLRLHDNPALLAAAADADHLCPLFILDPWFLKPDRCGGGPGYQGTWATDSRAHPSQAHEQVAMKGFRCSGA